MLVISDDLDQPLASVRLRQRGGHGGHNGVRSVIQHFGGSQDFPRLKIGACVCARFVCVCCMLGAICREKNVRSRPQHPKQNKKRNNNKKTGIGRPMGQTPVASFVLQPFKAAEMAEVDVAVAQSLDVIQAVLTLGLAKALSGVRA